MSRLLHSRPLAAALALAAALTALPPRTLGDSARFTENVEALTRADLAGAAQAGPVYAASFVLRLPAFLLAVAFGGDDLALYRAGSLLCMLIVGLLAWIVVRWMERLGRATDDRLVVAVILAGTAALLQAVPYGHPEEALGGALCVGAVLCAVRDRPELAGVLLGLAIANKPWGVIAIVPVLLVADGGLRRIVLGACSVLAAIVVPLWVISHLGHSTAAGTSELVASGAYWRPEQLFFPLGHVVHHTSGGVTYFGYRGPNLYTQLSHPLAVVIAPVLGLLLARRTSRLGRRVGLDALGLLGVSLLIRCAVDPWNITYYAIPAVLALVSWEALTRPGFPMLGAFTATGTWLSFVGLSLLGLSVNSALRYPVYVAFVGSVLFVALRRLLGDGERAPAVSRRVGPARVAC